MNIELLLTATYPLEKFETTADPVLSVNTVRLLLKVAVPGPSENVS